MIRSNPCTVKLSQVAEEFRQGILQIWPRSKFVMLSSHPVYSSEYGDDMTTLSYRYRLTLSSELDTVVSSSRRKVFVDMLPNSLISDVSPFFFELAQLT